RIYSEEGVGTTIKLYLPKAESAELIEEFPDREGYDDTAISARVLMVEDDALLQRSVAEELKRIGCAVTVASAARDAIGILEEDSQFELVFSDVIMPGGMSGADLAREVSRRWPAIKVILTSGYTAASALGRV